MPNCCRNRRGRSVGLCAEVRHSIAHSMTREQFGLRERVVSSTKLSVLGIRSHRQAQGAPDTFARILHTLTCPYRSPEAEPHRIASKPNRRLRRRQMFADMPSRPGHLCRRVTGEEKKQLSSGGGDAGGSTIRNTRPDPGGGVGRGRHWWARGRGARK